MSAQTGSARNDAGDAEPIDGGDPRRATAQNAPSGPADVRTSAPEQRRPNGSGADRSDPTAQGQAQGKDKEDGKDKDDPKNKDKDKDKDKEKDAQAPTARWPWVVAGAVVLVFIAVTLFIIFAPHRLQRTTDAYVSAHYAMIAPRVAGQVIEVAVNDNQPVRAGQLLVALDPRDYLAALRQAEAALAADQAQIEQTRAEVERQPSQISKAAAEEEAAAAKLTLAQADAVRYRNLAATGAGTVQQRQQADAQLLQDKASVRSGQADLTAQRQQLRALEANELSARARVLGDQAAVERARLNVEYTRIAAPLDGTIDQRNVQVGDFVSPGAAMMIQVPLQALYITANYRELALRHMRPGQRARIHVDAYDFWLDGVVDSVAPASGGALSPIPANNATGNFTKIVQRLPVKVRVLPGQRLARLLRAGLSVEVDVDTRLEDLVADQRETAKPVLSPAFGASFPASEPPQ